MFVRVSESTQNISQNPDCFIDWQLTASADSGSERFALDKGHRIVWKLAGYPGRVYRDDMRVLQSCSELNLPAKSLQVYTGSELMRQDLDYNVAAECGFFGNEHA